GVSQDDDTRPARRPERVPEPQGRFQGPGGDPRSPSHQGRHHPWGDRGMKRRLLLALLAFLLVPGVALAQGLNLESLIPADEQSVTGRMVQIVLLITVLSVAPGLLVMVTCFTRFVIVLSLLRTG